MTDAIKKANEIASLMMKYKISEENMKAIIDSHEGDVKAAVRTIEYTAKMLNGISK